MTLALYYMHEHVTQAIYLRFLFTVPSWDLNKSILRMFSISGDVHMRLKIHKSFITIWNQDFCKHFTAKSSSYLWLMQRYSHILESFNIVEDRKYLNSNKFAEFQHTISQLISKPIKTECFYTTTKKQKLTSMANFELFRYNKA